MIAIISKMNMKNVKPISANISAIIVNNHLRNNYLLYLSI